jgi:hypothetical protein
MSFEYKESIISARRAGVSSDPYIPISINRMIKNGLVQLTEIPDSFQKVAVTGNSQTWYEIANGTPTGTQYKVSYLHGYIEFDPSHDGKTLTFSFKGTGNTFISSERVWVESDGTTVLKTIHDVIVDAQEAAVNANEAADQANATNMAIQAEEAVRVSIEASRQSAETARNTQESQRQSAEANRAGAENSRVSAENARVSAESSRGSAEQARGTAEASRAGAESGRAAAEATRQTDETTRQSQEAARQADTADAINSLNTKAASLTHKGNYSAGATYVANNIVFYQGSTYMCIASASTGNLPTHAAYWRKIHSGSWRGAYSAAATYQTGDCVIDALNQNMYTSITDSNFNQPLTDELKWQLSISVSGVIQTVNNTNTNVTTAENARVAAEASRVSAEAARTSAETARAGAETTRSGNESARQSNESARQTNEGNRGNAESGRSSAESSRVTAENGRVVSENARISAETTRASNETARQSNEGTRQSQELSRQSDTSAAISNLNAIANALAHKGTYSGATAYEVNNIVYYQGSTYMCIATSTGNAPTNTSNWRKIHTSNWRGAYSSATSYLYGDCVVDASNQNVYVSIIDSNLNQALSDSTKWQLMISVSSVINTVMTTNTNVTNAESLRVTAENNRLSDESSRVSAETGRATTEGNRATAETGRVNAEAVRSGSESTRQGNESTRQSNESTRQANETVRQNGYNAFKLLEAYNPAQAYVPMNKVTYQGSTYQCILASTGNLPTHTTYWILIAQKGDGNIASITSTNADISVGGTAGNPTLTLNSGAGANQIVKRDASGSLPGNITGNAASVTTNANLSGDVTSVGNVTSIATGVIVNADIHSSAAIDVSKIANGTVSNSEFQYLDGVTSSIQTQLNGKQNTLGFVPESSSSKGAANGYASLDSGAKVPASQLPDSIVGQVEYQGTWNASTNTPTLPSAASVKGHYYVTSAAGTYSSISYEVGDWVISNGNVWQKVDNTDAVPTVFGRTGNVVAAANDYSWAQINKAASSIADITTRNLSDLTQSSAYRTVTDAEKTKLAGIADSANNYVHPAGDGNQHVPATGTANNAKVLKAGTTAGSAAWGIVDWSEISNKPAFDTSGSAAAVQTNLNAHAATAATTSVSGHVVLNNTISSTSTTQAATANAVKTAYDKANSALQTTGGTMTGFVTLHANPISSLHAVTKQYVDAQIAAAMTYQP